MKKIMFVLLVISALSVSLTHGPDKNNKNDETTEIKGIKFQKISFDDALLQAKSSNKLIFIDAYAVWCGPCKWMEANTFTDQKVGEFFNENFINLKIDMEKGEGPSIAKKYQVSAYPTMFFIDGKGEVVHRIIGAVQPTDLLKEAKSI